MIHGIIIKFYKNHLKQFTIENIEYERIRHVDIL